jgi:hypothetical protein
MRDKTCQLIIRIKAITHPGSGEEYAADEKRRPAGDVQLIGKYRYC